MTEVGEFAIWFSVAAFCVALLWGFFVVAWRAREMMVRFLTSVRAVRVWKRAAEFISPPIVARITAFESKVIIRMAEFEAKVSGELALVGPRMALALPESPDFATLQAEMQSAIGELKEVKSMLMGNLTKMRHGVDKLGEIEEQAMRSAAAELGLEAQDIQPELLRKAKFAKLAARLDPNDPSLSLIEAAGVVLAREALERADKDGGFAGLLKGRKASTPSGTNSVQTKGGYY
jgi:hypothetical protein